MTKDELAQLKIDLIENTEAYWLPLLDELFRLAELGRTEEDKRECFCKSLVSEGDDHD